MTPAPFLPAALLAVTLLAGCNSTPRDRGTAAQQAACRERADEIYIKQNRAEIYAADRYATSTRDAPYGSSGLVGVTSAGLSGRYARDGLITDCINGLTNNTAPASGATPDRAVGGPPPGPSNAARAPQTPTVIAEPPAGSPLTTPPPIVP